MTQNQKKSKNSFSGHIYSKFLYLVTKSRQGKEEKYFIHTIGKRKGHMEIKIRRHITAFGKWITKIQHTKEIQPFISYTPYSSKSRALLKGNMVQANNLRKLTLDDTSIIYHNKICYSIQKPESGSSNDQIAMLLRTSPEVLKIQQAGTYLLLALNLLLPTYSTSGNSPSFWVSIVLFINSEETKQKFWIVHTNS